MQCKYTLSLSKYLLIPFHRYMRHSMFNLENIQTINIRKIQDYYTIIQKWFDFNFVLFFMNVLLFCYKGNIYTVLKQLLVLVLCLLRKNVLSFQNIDPKKWEEKKLFFRPTECIFYAQARNQKFFRAGEVLWN